MGSGGEDKQSPSAGSARMVRWGCTPREHLPVAVLLRPPWSRSRLEDTQDGRSRPPVQTWGLRENGKWSTCDHLAPAQRSKRRSRMLPVKSRHCTAKVAGVWGARRPDVMSGSGGGRGGETAWLSSWAESTKKNEEIQQFNKPCPSRRPDSPGELRTDPASSTGLMRAAWSCSCEPRPAGASRWRWCGSARAPARACC